MIKKEEIYALFRERGIPYEAVEHRAVYTMEELAEVELPYPDAEAKNLFVRDDKHRTYLLIVMKGEKRIDLKALRRAYGTRPLTFASEEELSSFLALTRGAVSPLGILNDTERRVAVWLDEDLLCGEGKIGVHPNDNTATVYLSVKDLVTLLEEHGNEVHLVKLPCFGESHTDAQNT